MTLLDGVLRPERAEHVRATLERAYREDGWIGFWRAELTFAQTEAARPGTLWTPVYSKFTDTWQMARRYARVGDWDRALDALDAAYVARHHLVATLPLDPLFAPLRTHPRFRDLLRKTGAAM
jgi:hypothetical protein